MIEGDLEQDGSHPLYDRREALRTNEVSVSSDKEKFGYPSARGRAIRMNR